MTDYRVLILNTVDAIQPAVAQQATACYDFSARLKNATDIRPESFQIFKMAQNEVAELTSDVFLNALVFQVKGIDQESEEKKQIWCFNLMNQYKYLKRVEDQIATVYAAYQEQATRLSDKWELGLFKLEKALNKKSLTPATEEETSLRSEVMNIWDEWVALSAEGASNVLLTLDKMISPIERLLDQTHSKTSDNQFALELSTILEGLTTCHAEWVENNEIHSEIFEAVAPKITEIMKNLNTTKDLVAEKTTAV